MDNGDLICGEQNPSLHDHTLVGRHIRDTWNHSFPLLMFSSEIRLTCLSPHRYLNYIAPMAKGYIIFRASTVGFHMLLRNRGAPGAVFVGIVHSAQGPSDGFAGVGAVKPHQIGRGADHALEVHSLGACERDGARGVHAFQYSSVICLSPCSGLGMSLRFLESTTKSRYSSGIWPSRLGTCSPMSTTSKLP